MEELLSVFGVIKSWLYKCASLILLISLLGMKLPELVVLIATWSIVVIFVDDILTMVLGFVNSVREEEWSALGVISFILSVLTLAASIVFYFFGVAMLEEVGILLGTDALFGKIQLAAVCVIVWHFLEEFLSLPISILAIFADDGEY